MQSDALAGTQQLAARMVQSDCTPARGVPDTNGFVRALDITHDTVLMASPRRATETIHGSARSLPDFQSPDRRRSTSEKSP
jgi:hypothetical protein